jgi:hypothetical protein
VALVVVFVHKSTGQTSTAAVSEVSNRTEAFQVQSRSLVNAKRDLKRGALIIDGERTSFLGTILYAAVSFLSPPRFTTNSVGFLSLTLNNWRI